MGHLLNGLVLIKPDGVIRGLESNIVRILVEVGLSVMWREEVVITRPMITRLWPEFTPRLHELSLMLMEYYLVDNKSIALGVRGVNVNEKTAQAKEIIRKRYKVGMLANVVHAACTQREAAMQVSLLCPNREFPILNAKDESVVRRDLPGFDWKNRLVNRRKLRTLTSQVWRRYPKVESTPIPMGLETTHAVLVSTDGKNTLDSAVGALLNGIPSLRIEEALLLALDIDVRGQLAVAIGGATNCHQTADGLRIAGLEQVSVRCLPRNT